MRQVLETIMVFLLAILVDSRIILNMETQNESNEKLAMYKTARMVLPACRLIEGRDGAYMSDYETVADKGEYVSVEFAGHDVFMGRYFTATTVSGRKFTAFEKELTEFCL